MSDTPRQKALPCLITATVVAALATAGCPDKSAPAAAGSASPSASAPVASAKPSQIPRPIPLSQQEIDSTVNPTKIPVYKGPTGTVRGNISVKGDQAPSREDVIAQINPKCQAAQEIYGKLFREGMMRSLADALVTVTGYDGYLPARGGEARLVEAKNCSWDSRTIALMFGQRIDVQSKDSEPYLPDLLGGSMPAQMVAIPGREPVNLYPMKVGRYGLGDTLHPFSFADVFVIKYPTFAVTGLDGKYEITGIPVGEVTVTAVLPITMRTAEKKVKIEADRAILVDLVIPFDKKKDMPKPPPKPEEQKGKRKLPVLH